MSKIYPCVYCTEDGHCEKYSDEKVTSWCVQGPCQDEKPSNADRIRAMTDKELAEFIEYLTSGCDYMYPECYARKFCTSGGCYSAWLDWLKQEQ